MAMTPEGKVKKSVRQVLDRLGAYYVMPVTGGYGRQGAPDFLVCYRGKFYGIECKANGGKTTALQDKHLAVFFFQLFKHLGNFFCIILSF